MSLNCGGEPGALPDGTGPAYEVAGTHTNGADVTVSNVEVESEGETVRIAVQFGDFPGKYPLHCHVLEHEEHDMMRPFEVVSGNDTDKPGRSRHKPGCDWHNRGRGRGRHRSGRRRR